MFSVNICVLEIDNEITPNFRISTFRFGTVKQVQKDSETIMGFLRGFGYFIAIVILIIGIVLFPYGIPLVIGAIVMMYVLHKGGQVTSMQKEMKSIRKLQEENQRLKLEQIKKDALNHKDTGITT